MAFTKTLVARYPLGNGSIREVYTWDGAGVTTGVVAPDTTDAEGIGKIKEIDMVSATNDVTSTVVALNAARSEATLTFTAADTGHVTIEGRAK